MQESLNELIIKSQELLKNISENWITIELVFKIVLFYMALIWLWIIIWTARDIISRTSNLFYQLIWVLSVIILTPIWIFIYFLIRPQYTKSEREYNNMVLNSEKNKKSKKINCKSCWYNLKKSFKICPICAENTWFICSGCDNKVNPNWEKCPYCENKLKKEDILIKKA